jgi:hypothetical protein
MVTIKRRLTAAGERPGLEELALALEAQITQEKERLLVI